MKIYVQTTNGENVSEKEVSTLKEAQQSKKANEKIHICRHEEGLPCSLE